MKINHANFFQFLLLSLLGGATPGLVTSQDFQTIEEVVVRAQRQNGMLDDLKRDYRSVDGKRLFDGPYGDNLFILAISQELKNRGEMKRIMTRRISMPPEFPGSSLNRYHYPVSDECGIEKFQLFDGGEFIALGYEISLSEGRTEIIFDVLVGGGPFASPSLWGPYDQIIGRRHGMDLIMGDAAKDGMGLMKSGYAVGMKAELSGFEFTETGDVYGNAVNDTGKCLAEKSNIEAAKNFLSR